MDELENKEIALHTIIAGLENVAVAYSGGADSTYLLAVCLDVLGIDKVLAGANAVAYPAPETVELATERGLAVRFVERCCTILDAEYTAHRAI